MNKKRGLNYDDILMLPGKSIVATRTSVSLDTEFMGATLSLPVLNAPMTKVASPELGDVILAEGGGFVSHRFCPISEQKNVLSFLRTNHPKGFLLGSVGLNATWGDLNDLMDAGANGILLDVAAGYANSVAAFLEEFGDRGIQIAAGNVVTELGAKYLSNCGASAVRVGIGNGSACSTSKVTGFGCPQLTAVRNCSAILQALDSDCQIIADGGIKHIGDIAKAIFVGKANVVMMGKMFAETEQAGNDGIFSGMAAGGPYNEGIVMTVNARRDAFDLLTEIKEGLQSAVSYSGNRSLQEAYEDKNIEYIKLT